ncbi:MAG: 5-bromo-4-chloroindolyl phosphate hydrolysis family protein [Oscillospiraceae bacterium]|nr:5-bromo-4-chloroindolyl phosphate hydrolysis family protein [Oscillospiraceae bacterium]
MNNNSKNNFEKEPNPGENLDREKKMAEAEKKSAFPILSVGLTWLAVAVVFHGLFSPTKIFLTAVLSFIIYQIAKKKFPAKKIEIMMEAKKESAANEKNEKKEAAAPAVPLTPEERELKDLNERINLYFIEIKLLNDSIGDEFVSAELGEIEKNLKKIQFHLNEKTEASKTRKIEQLTQFFDYYMPTTIKILNSYRRIESQELTGENATETKKRVEESLPFVRKAFEKELDNMFSDEMIDITTDIDVLEAVLSKEGLIEKNPIGEKDTQNDPKNSFFD